MREDGGPVEGVGDSNTGRPVGSSPRHVSAVRTPRIRCVQPCPCWIPQAAVSGEGGGAHGADAVHVVCGSLPLRQGLGG